MPTLPTSTKPRTQQSDPAELEEQIRHRAYELYEQRKRKGTDGTDVDDWLQAEAEVSGKKTRTTAA